MRSRTFVRKGRLYYATKSFGFCAAFAVIFISSRVVERMATQWLPLLATAIPLALGIAFYVVYWWATKKILPKTTLRLHTTIPVRQNDRVA